MASSLMAGSPPAKVIAVPTRRQDTATTAPISCSICPRVFLRMAEVVRHVEESHTTETCVLCGDSALGRPAMDAHLDTRHVPHAVECGCQTCGVKFGHPSHLSKHLHDFHVQRSCQKCGLAFQTGDMGRDQLVKHVLRCGTQVNRPSLADTPVTVVIGSNHHCGQCGVILKTPTDFRVHKYSCHRENLFGSAGGRGGGRRRQHQSGRYSNKRPLSERAVNAAAATTSVLENKRVKMVAATAPQPGSPLPRSVLLSHDVSITPISGTKPSHLHRCPKCVYSTNQKSNLSRHFEAFHVTFKCRGCAQPLLGRKLAFEHMRKYHPDENDRYDLNDAYYPEDTAWMNSIRDIPRVPLQAAGEVASVGSEGAVCNYSCRRCRFVTDQYSLWIRHKCGAVAAETAGPRPTQRDDDATSAAVGFRQSRLPCPVCKDSFSNSGVLSFHMATVHGMDANEVLPAHEQKRCHSWGEVAKLDSNGNPLSASPARRRRISLTELKRRRKSEIPHQENEDSVVKRAVVVAATPSNGSDTDSVPEGLVGGGPGYDEELMAKAFAKDREKAEAAALAEKAEYFRCLGFDLDEARSGAAVDGGAGSRMEEACAAAVESGFDAAMKSVMKAQSENSARVSVEPALTCLDLKYTALQEETSLLGYSDD